MIITWHLKPVGGGLLLALAGFTRLRKNSKTVVILSAAKNLSSISVHARTLGEILRYAQNDKITKFHSICTSAF